MSRNEAARSQKMQLRTQFRGRRDALEQVEAARGSRALSQRLEKADELRFVRRIAGYAALGREVDVQTFLKHSIEQGVEVSLPRVTGPGKMDFCAIDDWDDLEPGAFGILEPSGRPVSTDEIEVFLVPGLAFDRRGHRLGFGKGFYDRALPAVGEAVAIGIGYHWQLVDDDLPAESHDRPVDYIVTDREWYRPSRLDLTGQE